MAKPAIRTRQTSVRFTPGAPNKRLYIMPEVSNVMENLLLIIFMVVAGITSIGGFVMMSIPEYRFTRQDKIVMILAATIFTASVFALIF